MTDDQLKALVNDCTRPLDAGDRSLILKALERLPSQHNVDKALNLAINCDDCIELLKYDGRALTREDRVKLPTGILKAVALHLRELVVPKW